MHSWLLLRTLRRLLILLLLLIVILFATTEEPAQELTVRELEVLELVADRLSNKEIGARLVISEHTVKNHLKNILGKLHLRSRRQAADYGVARGWLRPVEPS